MPADQTPDMQMVKVSDLNKGKLTRRAKGVPQGSPVSPLLSNILLHELDKELEHRGHHYVRYADGRLTLKWLWNAAHDQTPSHAV